jgi:hypothetical protein
MGDHNGGKPQELKNQIGPEPEVTRFCIRVAGRQDG